MSKGNGEVMSVTILPATSGGPRAIRLIEHGLEEPTRAALEK